jgi:hypothetical protein
VFIFHFTHQLFFFFLGFTEKQRNLSGIANFREPLQGREPRVEGATRAPIPRLQLPYERRVAMPPKKKAPPAGKKAAPKKTGAARKKIPPAPIMDSDSSDDDDRSYDYSAESDTELTGIESDLNDMDLGGRRRPLSPPGYRRGHRHSPERGLDRHPPIVIDKEALEVFQTTKAAEYQSKQRILCLAISGIHPGISVSDIELIIPQKGAVDTIHLEYPPKPKLPLSGQVFNAADAFLGMETKTPCCRGEYGVHSDIVKKMQEEIDKTHRTDGATKYRQRINLKETVERYTVTGTTPARHNEKGMYFFQNMSKGTLWLNIFFLCTEKHPDAGKAFDQNQAYDMNEVDDPNPLPPDSPKNKRPRGGGSRGGGSRGAGTRTPNGMEVEVDSTYRTADKGSRRSAFQNSPTSRSSHGQQQYEDV